MSKLNQNTTTLNELLEIAQGLPEALDTSDATAEASEILAGESAYVNGEKVEGAMPNNGSISATFDGIDTTSVTIPEGYTSGGTVGLTSAIGDEVSEQAGLIEQISAALEGKSVGGGSESGYDTCTVTIDRTSEMGSSKVICSVFLTQVINGEINTDECYTDTVNNLGTAGTYFPKTYENVLCGTNIVLLFNDLVSFYGATCSGGVETVGHSARGDLCIKAPVTAGAHGYYTIDAD